MMVDEAHKVQISKKDKDICLQLFLKTKIDRVYIHPNGKKVIGSLLLMKHRHTIGLAGDINLALNPIKLSTSRSRQYDELLSIDTLHRIIVNHVVREFLRSNNLKIEFNLSSAYHRVVSPFIKEQKICTDHCQSILDHVKEECKRLQETGHVKMKLSRARKTSATKKLRPKLAIAARVGLEEADIIELWRIILVEDVINS